MKAIFDNKGQLRGYLEEGSSNARSILDKSGRRLGYYLYSADKTYDAQGKYVGPGDQRMTLLTE